MSVFGPCATPTPAKPSRIQLVLDVTETAPGARQYAGSFEFVIPTSDGRVIDLRKGNLEPVAPVAVKQAIKDLLDWALNQAQDTVP